MVRAQTGERQAVDQVMAVSTCRPALPVASRHGFFARGNAVQFNFALLAAPAPVSTTPRTTHQVSKSATRLASLLRIAALAGAPWANARGFTDAPGICRLPNAVRNRRSEFLARRSRVHYPVRARPFRRGSLRHLAPARAARANPHQPARPLKLRLIEGVGYCERS